MQGNTFYNEIDPYAAQWLRNLIEKNLVQGGIVDTRTIHDINSSHLNQFSRAHFFAGIGGWDLALRLAGWPSDRPVWTGSCPCQPFSAAGRRGGIQDPRHLWPEFRRLIEQSRPPVVFGEQVASKDGRSWLAGVRTDLEAMGYRVGAADLCAASVNAPHIRQRLFWVAESEGQQHDGRWPARDGRAQPTNGCRLGVAGRQGLPTREPQDIRGAGRREEGRAASQPGRAQLPTPVGVAHPDSRGPAPRGLAAAADGYGGSAVADGGPWSTFRLVGMLDGKTRRIGSEVFPLAHGVSARVGKLRASGNAIVPQVAAEFIRAYLEARGIGYQLFENPEQLDTRT